MSKKVEVEIEEHTCATERCGVTFWFSEAYGDRRRQDHQGFHCPNGHSLVYKGETDAQKLSRITREKNEEIARLQSELRKKSRKQNKKK